MSAREKLMQEIDFIPDRFIEVMYAMWEVGRPGNYETPNEETLEDLDNPEYVRFNSSEEMYKALLGDDYAEKY
ncbi:MAG: hypothetical protein LBM87_04925 [Ruminococcus sp.]|jgi:hypothetical protein|nr:hypothetical protein [Ruminococcus sp.]